MASTKLTEGQGGRWYRLDSERLLLERFGGRVYVVNDQVQDLDPSLEVTSLVEARKLWPRSGLLGPPPTALERVAGEELFPDAP